MIYLISSIIIVIFNVIPAFMPPTWTVISYVYIRYDTNLLLLTFIGALSSSFGRVLLSRSSHTFGNKVLSNGTEESLTFLGKRIEGKGIRMFTIALVWAMSPIASNPLFIAVGLSNSKLRAVISGFFIGRIISYFILAYTTSKVVENLNDLFFDGVFTWQKILVEIISIFLIMLYVALDWKELILNKKIKFNFFIFKFKK